MAEERKDEFLDSEDHPSTTHDEEREKISQGKKEGDVYSEEGREELSDGDEIAAWEEGFAEGAAGKGRYGKCAQCGKPLGDREEGTIERKIKGDIALFCSTTCAEKGVKN